MRLETSTRSFVELESSAPLSKSIHDFWQIGLVEEVVMVHGQESLFDATPRDCSPAEA